MDGAVVVEPGVAGAVTVTVSGGGIGGAAVVVIGLDTRPAANATRPTITMTRPPTINGARLLRAAGGVGGNGGGADG